jgi:methylmalonyl-CoA mutase N-terminal domain/subunit
VANTVDPLAGSYYIEWLTDLIEKETIKYMAELESKGNVIELIEKGYIQSEMARVAYDTTKAKMSGEHIVVGVNKFKMEGDTEEIQIHQPNEEAVERQIARVKQLKKERDNVKVKESLKNLKVAAEGTENMMPLLIDAVKAYATVEEIVTTLKDVFGEFVEPV